MKSIRPCRLFGIYEAVAGMKDNVVILHTVTGCHFASLSIKLGNSMTDVNQTSTIINDKDIIVNGEKSLRKSIINTIKLYKPKSITVVTGCVAEIVKDDVSAVIKEFENQVDIMYINGAGFMSDFLEGYEYALLEFIKKYAKVMGTKLTVNVFGVLAHDYKISEDIKALKNFFGENIQVNFISIACINEIKAFSKNSLNICFGRGKVACEYLENKLNIPFELMDYPYGLTGLKSLCDVVEKHFQVSLEEKYNIAEQETVNGLKKVYSYLDSFYGLPIGIVGSTGKIQGMKKFVQNELGMDIELEFNTDTDQDYESFIEKCKVSNIALIFGSSFDHDISNRLQVPLIRYEYPVFDRVSISPVSFVGTDGVINFVESLINSVMDGVKNRGGLYNEKDMFLW